MDYEQEGVGWGYLYTLITHSVSPLNFISLFFLSKAAITPQSIPLSSRVYAHLLFLYYTSHTGVKYYIDSAKSFYI